MLDVVAERSRGDAAGDRAWFSSKSPNSAANESPRPARGQRTAAHRHSALKTAATARSARLHRQICPPLLSPPSPIPTALHTVDGACLLGPHRLSSRLIRRRSPTRPGPTLHPRIRSSTIRHNTTALQRPSLAPSPGPPLCDRLATAVSPTRSSILTPASQPHTLPQPAGCPPPSTAPPSSCPARPVGAPRGHTWARRSLGVHVDAHAVPAASPGLRRPARSHKTPCRPL
jgi:hypothetical protein